MLVLLNSHHATWVSNYTLFSELNEAVRHTAWKGPSKCHDDVTKIVRVPYQAPPARNQESPTSWSQNGFCICGKNVKGSLFFVCFAGQILEIGLCRPLGLPSEIKSWPSRLTAQQEPGSLRPPRNSSGHIIFYFFL